MIDAKFPQDLMVSVQAAPTELSLVAPKKKRVARKPGVSHGKGSARGGGGSTTAEALAAAATPLGGAGAASAGRSTRSAGAGRASRSGSRAATGAAKLAEDPDVIVLD